MKKIIAIALAALMLCSVASFDTFAAQNSKSISILNYNVAGLPDLNHILGKGGKDVNKNQAELGKILNTSGYDIIAVQEDFNYHSSLVAGMTAYKYKTIHTGGVPGGDGMNIYTLNTPIYNEKRTKWDKLYGVIEDGADELTPKGILYACLDLGDGILVDFYDIHADAYGDAGSLAARTDNFRQLAEIIQKRGDVRPVIVTGDFNTTFHHRNDSGPYDYLVQKCAFKDAWVELYNNGNYTDFSDYLAENNLSYDNYWGIWDSVEKILYKDGGGISIEPTSFAYKTLMNSDGESISDHRAAEGTFTLTKTESFTENSETLKVTKENKLDSFIKKVFVFFTDLFNVFTHWDELKIYLGL